MEQQNPWTPAAPPRSSSTGLIVGLAVGGAMLLLLIVAAGGIFAYSLLKSQQNSAPQGDPDEIVLRQEPGSGPALRYGTTPVYDACSLVTIDGLSRLDVSLSRDYFVAHEHLDADVPVSAAITADTPDPISNCFYMLSSEDSLHVRVHQTPFNSSDELTRMQERATRQNAAVVAEAGMSSVAWHDDEYESQHLVIWRPELVVDISLRSEDSDGTLDPASFMPRLESLVRSGLSSPPTAPIRHTYLAPFDKVKDPCAAASVEAYRAAFPSAPGAPSMVDGSYRLDAPIPDSQRGFGKSREAQLSCTRNNIVPRGTLNPDHRSLQVDLSVWTAEKAADRSNYVNCAPSYKSRHADPVPITPPVGTRKSCLADYDTDWLLKFQVSNVNVTVGDGDTDGKPDVSARRDQLVSVRLVLIFMESLPRGIAGT
ncbi:hypothetical protein LFM09_03220 [Lentzea alba]|uniref:hypothetical protein n=1 Tax=Lentzea alba TaxID=2714351 RepID=UPI0039BF8FEC